MATAYLAMILCALRHGPAVLELMSLNLYLCSTSCCSGCKRSSHATTLTCATAWTRMASDMARSSTTGAIIVGITALSRSVSVSGSGRLMHLNVIARLPMAGMLEACGGRTTSRICACRLSELRTLELLDGLCKQLDAYEYQPPTDSDPEGSWLRFSKPDKTTEERTQAHQRTQQV